MVLAVVLCGGSAATGQQQAAASAAKRNNLTVPDRQCRNNLRRIGLALRQYHDTQGAFPPWASYSKDGKPLLSWRVHLLTYLGQFELYSQFHLDEPWYSEHNKKLIGQMPAVYRCPNQKLTDKGKTTYLAPLGKTTMFTGQAEGTKISERTPSSGANTILLVDADDDHAVIWTKPDDLKYDPGKPLAGLFGHHQGLAAVLFADASVGFVRQTIAPKDLQALFDRNAGGKVRLPAGDVLIDDTAYLEDVSSKPPPLGEARVRDLARGPGGLQGRGHLADAEEPPWPCCHAREPLGCVSLLPFGKTGLLVRWRP
jgi:hypothetical protein